MKRLLLRSPLLLGALSIVLTVACGRPKTEAPAPVVAAVLPLTGDLAFLGDPGRAALEIAEADLNTSGTKIHFSPQDSKASPKDTVTTMRRERDVEQRNLFIVTLSGPAMAAREAFKNEDVALLAIAIHPDLAVPSAPLVRFCVSAKQEGAMLAGQLGKTKTPIGLVVSKDAATLAEVEGTILPALKAADKPVAFVEWFDVGNKDFHTLAARLGSVKPTELLLLGYGSDFPAALEAVAVSGAKDLTIYGGIGFVEMTKRPTGLDTSRFKFVVPAYSVGATGSASLAFRQSYKKAKGVDPPYDAAFTYDAAKTLGALLRSGKRSPSEILAGIRGHSFDGVTGHITFDQNGESTSDLRWATFGTNGIEETKP